MRRRTYRKIKAASSASHHHHVYVVLLSPEAAQLPEIRAANPHPDPKKPCLYVGMSGLLARSHGYSSGSWTNLINTNQTIAASCKYNPFGGTISSSGTLASVNTVGGWIGTACRRSCEDCCKAKVGYNAAEPCSG